MSFILLSSLFYRDGGIIILPVSWVSGVHAILLMLMQVQGPWMITLWLCTWVTTVSEAQIYGCLFCWTS